MAWASPRGTAPQLLLVLSLLLAAAIASLLPLSNNAPPPRLPPAAKAREGGASVSAGLLSTLREALDAVKDVTSIISSFPIGGILGDGGGDLRLSSAVADCLDLLDLSSDEMSWSMSMSTDSSGAGGGRLGTGDARSDLQSWLSGALGNQDTCKEGLDATGSVLGSLVAAGLDAVTSLLADGLGQVAGGDDATAPASSLPPSSSRRGAAPPRWLRARERRLLQMPVGPGGLAVDAVVAQDGSGNFTTVGEAVAAAPNNSETRFVIYIKAGGYFENVEVGSEKTNLMFVGDGMWRTVIKASRNVVDNSTTFRSATLGQ